MAKANPRRSNGSRRTKQRKALAARQLPCHICGEPIDYSLPPGDPLSFEVDELVPVSRWQEGGYASAEQCALDPNNQAPAHRICNQRRGNRMLEAVEAQPTAPIITSRDWVAFAQKAGGSPSPTAAAHPGA